MITRSKIKLLVFILMFLFSFPLFAEGENELPQNLMSAHIESNKKYFRFGRIIQEADMELFFTENIPFAIKDGELNIQIVGRTEYADVINKVMPLFISGQPHFITNNAIKIDNITVYEKGIKLNLHRLNNEAASFSISELTMGVKEKNICGTCDIILSGTALSDDNKSLTLPNLFRFSEKNATGEVSCILSAISSNSIKKEVTFRGQQPKILHTLYTETGPYLNQNRDIMVPVNCFYNDKIRFKPEKIHLSFNRENKQLIITEKSRRLVITAGSSLLQKECCLIINGEPRYIKAADKMLSSPAELVNNRVFISAKDMALLNNWTLSLNSNNELRFYDPW